MTTRPRLLDLFCKAGGCSVGYHRAGFDLVGVDIEPQPRYPFVFVQADVLKLDLSFLQSFDAIHASPPCQHYSKATAWRGSRRQHPDLIGTVRGLLLAAGKPYVIETVEDGRNKLVCPVMLCGSMFGLKVRRHRAFELSWCPLILTPSCVHRADDFSFDHGFKQAESVYRDAMGCAWMTVHESRQAIPPAYTEFLGRQIKRHMETVTGGSGEMEESDDPARE